MNRETAEILCLQWITEHPLARYQGISAHIQYVKNANDWRVLITDHPFHADNHTPKIPPIETHPVSNKQGETSPPSTSITKPVSPPQKTTQKTTHKTTPNTFTPQPHRQLYDKLYRLISQKAIPKPTWTAIRTLYTKHGGTTYRDIPPQELEPLIRNIKDPKDTEVEE